MSAEDTLLSTIQVYFLFTEVYKTRGMSVGSHIT
jgi:hypothetical protein